MQRRRIHNNQLKEAAEGMAATTATVMATTKTATGKDNDDNGRGRPRQRARTAMTTGEDDDVGKDGNSKDDGDDGKDDRQ
jgi:hypothetical protein